MSLLCFFAAILSFDLLSSLSSKNIEQRIYIIPLVLAFTAGFAVTKGLLEWERHI